MLLGAFCTVGLGYGLGRERTQSTHWTFGMDTRSLSPRKPRWVGRWAGCR